MDTDVSEERRHLLVEAVENSSNVDQIVDVDCSGNANSNCQQVTATVTLYLEDEDASDVGTRFKDALDEAIANGELQNQLQINNPSSVITVMEPSTSPTPTPARAPTTTLSTDGSDGNSQLSQGAMAGIGVAAAVAFIGALFGLAISRRSRRRKREMEAGGPEISSFRGVSTQALGRGEDSTASAMLGATSPNYGTSSQRSIKKSVKGFATLHDEGTDEGPAGAAAVRAKGHDESYESSSNAGSSGWSSSAGVSSLNTGSVDSLEQNYGAGAQEPHGSTLADIGIASAVAREKDRESGLQFVPAGRLDSFESENTSDLMEAAISGVERGSVPNLPNVSRADLDAAIEAGDWAAVGATAALLASASDNNSTSSRKSSSGTSKGSTISSIDAARAAELDHLVDAGDWEGVVLAAAQFEATDERDRETEGSISATSTSDERTGTGEGTRSTISDPTTKSGTSVGTSSAYSPSVSTTVSESPSKAQKRAEIRKEVETLVRRVVPDEIDNVDEMMNQFRGREEELVETLRTMQERSIAQRARAAIHRNAKREARRSRTERGSMPGLPPVAPRTQGEVQPSVADSSAPSASAAVGSWQHPQSAESGRGMSGGFAAAIGAGAAVGAGALSYGVTSAAKENNRKKDVPQASAKTAGGEASGKPPIHPTSDVAGAGKMTDESDSFSDPQFTGISTSTPTTGAASGKKRTTESVGSEDDGGSSSSHLGTSAKRHMGALGDSDSSEKSRNIRQAPRTALELAIVAGDWEAVGEAAAMMSDASITTVSTEEANRLAQGGYETDESSRRKGGLSGVADERAAELDRLIDKGDWSGVVAAASRFSAMDKKAGRGPGSAGVAESLSTNRSSSAGRKPTVTSKSTDSDSLSIDKDKALQEEQDALAQAEIWMAIAAQSKHEGLAEAKGASDAADWAISRSLSALRSAEQKGELSSQAVARKGSPISSAASTGEGSSHADKSV